MQKEESASSRDFSIIHDNEGIWHTGYNSSLEEILDEELGSHIPKMSGLAKWQIFPGMTESQNDWGCKGPLEIV